VCLKELENEHAQIAIIVSEPVVTYKETVTTDSTQVCLAKSPNKHNRLYVIASPLDNELANAIENKDIKPRDDPKELSKKLVE
jgi:elongation factor 2